MYPDMLWDFLIQRCYNKTDISVYFAFKIVIKSNLPWKETVFESMYYFDNNMMLMSQILIQYFTVLVHAVFKKKEILISCYTCITIASFLFIFTHFITIRN